MNHLIDTRFLTKEEIEFILARARYWETHAQEGSPELRGRFVANLFFEPSTRTRFSFEVAEKRLGLNVLNFQSEVSSTTKGESLYDTVKTLSSIGVEAVVIRHREEEDVLNLLEKDVGCAIINAGLGKFAHPTQALLDLYTIQKHFGKLDGLTVAIIGDLRHSRVARSNLWSLKTMGAKVVVSGPETMRDLEIEEHAPYLPLEEAIAASDVVMMLRIQLERHDQTYVSSREEYHQRYGMTEERIHLMKPGAILLHPAPVNRDVELAGSLVEHPRSKIFAQMTNGVWIRMAVLERALTGGKQDEHPDQKRELVGSTNG